MTDGDVLQLTPKGEARVVDKLKLRNTYIDGLRTDLSFTVFLNQPEDYDGGELVIDTAGHEDSIKGPAGSVVLYPSSSVHRVTEVTRGERLACVGWVQSRIKSPSTVLLFLIWKLHSQSLGRSMRPQTYTTVFSTFETILCANLANSSKGLSI